MINLISHCPRLEALVVAILIFATIARTAAYGESSFRSSKVSSSSSSSSRSTHNDGQLRCLQYHPDRMKTFPGWNQPLPSAWFSGYLDYELPGTGTTIHTHYVLVQAEEDTMMDDNNHRNGTTAEEEDNLPLIYWSNGGPGASSLFGLLTEIGPLILSDLSLTTDDYRATKIPSPQYNPYSWTKLGWILLIDQPAPVGFSYCNNNHTSHACGNISWTDELASLNAWTALQTFYETKFPCLLGKDLYLTGESYAGIYIPTLARRIVESNADKKANHTVTPPLKGFAVGDGCLGTQTTMCGGLGSTAGFADYWHIWFMAGHHQIPLQDYRMVVKACRQIDEPGFLMGNHNDNDDGRWQDSALCKSALAKTRKELGGFFEYALYDDCTYRNGLKWKQHLTGLDLLHPLDGYGNVDKMVGGAMNDYPCGGGPVMEQYLKLPIVLEAFHVHSDFFEVDNAIGFDYTPTEPDLQPFYKAMQGKLKVLVYNGDTDPAITSFATANWTSHLGFDEVQHWRPWTVDGCQQMGGYVTRYAGNFDFLTIRGAGHMVPTYKPAASLAFLKAWLQDEDYPEFDSNCTRQLVQNFEDASPPTIMSSAL